MFCQVEGQMGGGGGCVCISGASGGDSLFKLMSFFWRGGEAP